MREEVLKRRKIFGWLCMAIGWLCMAIGLCVGLSSCSDDDDGWTFRFDENGECYAPSVSPISQAEFEGKVVGNAWEHVSTHEIGRDGKCLPEEYYENNVGGGGPTTYFFENSHTLKSYYYTHAVRAGGFRTSAYNYEAGANRVTTTGTTARLQLLSTDGKRMEVIEYLAVRDGGTEVYGYSIYRKMSAQELERCQKDYSVDFNKLSEHTLTLSVTDEIVFVSGKEFEFDILKSYGPCTVKASVGGTCSIVLQENHVKVKLLKNGVRVLVSDGLKHREFGIFSTDEELEPKETDIYDFTYTELILNKEKKLVTTAGTELLYEYGRMGLTPREGYYGSILSAYAPMALLAVDTDKKIRYLRLNGGEILFKELLPQEVLDALVAAGEGHSIEYKLELVNHAGVVFQILPFKVTYK